MRILCRSAPLKTLFKNCTSSVLSAKNPVIQGYSQRFLLDTKGEQRVDCSHFKEKKLQLSNSKDMLFALTPGIPQGHLC